MKNFYIRRHIIRLLYSSLAFLLVFVTNLKAQPTPCTTPTSGLPFGGDFSIGGSNPVFSNTAGDYYVCIPPAASTLAITVFPSNSNSQTYIWDVQNNTNFLTSFPSSFVNSHVYNSEGVYYIAQKDVVLSQVICKKLTIFKNNLNITGVEIKLCGSKQVQVKIPSKSTNSANNHSRYVITWADGIIETVIPTTTDYSTTHSYTNSADAAMAVKIKGEYIDDESTVICSSNELSYTPNPANTIVINSLTTLSDKKSFDLEFVGGVSGSNYQVSYAKDDGTYTWNNFPTNAINGKITMSGSMFDITSTYCFKIKYVDNCSVSQESNVVCSIKLDDNLISSSSVNFNWNLPTIPSSIVVSNEFKKHTVGSGVSNLFLTSQTTHVFTDNTIDCNKQYEYWIENVYNQVQSDGTTSNIFIKSNTAKVNPITASTPPASKHPVIVSYTTNLSVNVNVLESVLSPQYIFYRSDNGSSTYTEIWRGASNSFVDNTVQAENNYYCYKFAYIDACGKTSALSDPYCTVFLTSNSTNTLNWTPYVIPNTVNATVSYQILRFDSVNGIFVGVSNTFNTQESVISYINSANNDIIKFQIIAVQNTTDLNGNPLNVYSNSNIYTFNLPPNIYIANAFTPNNDGKNDEFKPETKFVTSGEMTIFDRWGEIIFKTENLAEGWDGKINGQEAPVGTYSYRISAISSGNNVIIKTGVVTLLR